MGPLMNILRSIWVKAGLIAGLLLGIVALVSIGLQSGWWARLTVTMGGWFWWALLLFLVAGLLVVLIWLLPRYRAKRFLAQLRSEDTKAPMDEVQESHRKLQEKLLGAIRTLENSPDLKRKEGLPLYALPWYLLLGASQAGKTTLLRSVANSFTPFVRPASSIDSPTQDCDWWFFNTAIVLDTTGRYAFPAQVERDSARWSRFLQLLRHYRELQPINGVIVTVMADALM